MNKRFVSWKLFEGLAEKLYKRLEMERFDIIVCINRGGLVLGRMLSDRFDKPLGVISAIAYKRGKAKSKRIVFDKKVSLIGKLKGRILLVDDLVGSGKTVKAVSSYLKKIPKVKKVRTAVLFRKPSTKFEPDFFAAQSSKWIVFPYERKEF